MATIIIMITGTRMIATMNATTMIVIATTMITGPPTPTTIITGREHGRDRP